MHAPLTVHTTQFKSHQHDVSSTMVRTINKMHAPLTVHRTQIKDHQHDFRTMNNFTTLFFVPTMLCPPQRHRRREQSIDFSTESGSRHGPDQRTLQVLATTAIVNTFVVSRSPYRSTQPSGLSSSRHRRLDNHWRKQRVAAIHQ